MLLELGFSMLGLAVSLVLSSHSVKHIVDICLSDAGSLSWRMARLMLLVPPIGSTKKCFCMSQVIHDPCVFQGQPCVLLELLSSQLLQLLDLLSNGTSVVDPVLRLVHLCLEQCFVVEQTTGEDLKSFDFAGLLLQLFTLASEVGLC